MNRKDVCCDIFWVNLDINDGHIEYYKGWNITGCSQCYVLNDMKYCPFCGKKLKIGNDDG